MPGRAANGARSNADRNLVGAPPFRKAGIAAVLSPKMATIDARSKTFPA
jgi:hypothetical protein